MEDETKSEALPVFEHPGPGVVCTCPLCCPAKYEMNRSAWEVTAQINFDEPPEEEFNITVKKLVLPVKPRGVLAE